jgi:Leucine-rich repeat (LRR) protein
MMEEKKYLGVDVDWTVMSEEGHDEIKNFLESLGLERDVKANQSLARKESYQVKIFDMSFQLNFSDTYSEEWIEGTDLDYCDHWGLYIEENNYCHNFGINDQWIAAKIEDFDLEEADSPYVDTGEEYWDKKHSERNSKINSLSNQIKALSVKGSINCDDISQMKSLTFLNLSECGSLTDITALSCLTSLTTLNLGNCETLTDITALSGLTSLTSLDLSGCRSLTDITVLSGLTSLTSLDLSGCESLTDITVLSGLSSLTSLDLGGCRSLRDITALSVLTSLTSLDLSWCRSLTDITALSSLTSLTSLDLHGCKSLTDITLLSGLTSLTSLKLSSCESLTDITLSGLTSLTSLDLNSNSYLTKISLSGFVSLSDLNLSECGRLMSLSVITNATSLRKLNISDLKRLRPTETLEHLRSFTALEELDSPFHPSMVAELLAHTAVCRCDLNKISQSAREWLQESINFIDRGLAEQEQFASTLGSAFSLLGDHEIVPDYEAFLDARSEFSATPWKAWLGGLKKNQGHAALVRSVERVDLAQGSTGAIGGICASLPSSEAPTEEQEWARDWLARMETAQANNAKNLISVCAEICLAHARLGLQEALQRWLGRFTDASDPEALDPVHEALGHWQLQQGDTTAASEHAWSIRASQVRDPLLGKLVESCYENDPALACKALLYIVSLSLRANLASHLVAQETFASDARNMQCLIVACDSSIEAMTQLIKQAHPKADPTHLRALSEKLRQTSQSTSENQVSSLQKEI